MYEIGEYVYIFFREVAIEYINCGKVSYVYTTPLGDLLQKLFFFSDFSFQ